MAPRANWKGFLRLSLVTCPVALYPATSDSEKISFNQINRKTGHRIKYAKVDADTGEEVSNDDIMKGYKVDTDTYIEVSKDELENIALESTRTIDINEFVPKADIDPRYLIRPYYLVPDGKVGHDAFAVIRETIRNMDKPLAILGGAFGWGLKRNVLDIYKFLCVNYRPNDNIYGFGFSRGAFTMRVVTVARWRGSAGSTISICRRPRRRTSALQAPPRNADRNRSLETGGY